MKKTELIEITMDYLNGGDAPDDMKGRFHDQVVKKYIEAAFNDLVFQVYMEGKNFADYSVLDSWAKNYVVQVTTYGPRRGYAKLPYPPMQLPNNKGILQITPKNDVSFAFAYMETNSSAVFAELETGQIGTRPSFYIEQNIEGGIETHLLRFERLIAPYDQDLYVKMIVPLSKVDDFDEVMIPAGKEKLLIDEAVQMMIGKPPPDTVNDNIPAR